MAGKKAFLVAAAVCALLASAVDARANDDFRNVVREEVKSYLSAQQSDGGDNVFKVYWKDGLRLDTQDGKVKLKIGGRVMFDTVFYSASDYQEALGGTGFGGEGEKILSGFELRRLRFYNAGQIGKHVKFKLQVDFGAGGKDDVDFSIKDAYVEIGNLRDCFFCGAPNLRAGHFFAPFSLEAQTSSKYITFMERAAPTDAFAPSRRSGIMLHDAWLGDQFHIGTMFLADVTGDGQDGVWENPHVADGGTGFNQTEQEDEMEEGWGIAARIAWTPWYDCDCACNRWQIGGSVWYRADLDRVRYRARPDTHLTSHRPVDTGDIATDSALHWGVETALTWGPWSLQGEYFQAMPDVEGDPTLQGWYGYISYWLTGECRNLKGSVFSRVRPCCDFLENDCCCWGGWELAFRVDSIDLNDGNINGGEMMNYTFGINWHLNPNARIMFNFVFTDIDNAPRRQIVDQDMFAVGIRFQVDW